MRRCQRVSKNSVIITQCGNSPLTDYPQDDKAVPQADAEYQLRGPNFNEGLRSPLQTKFYVVYTSDFGNMCVENRDNCKMIVQNQTFADITNNTICSSCYTDLNWVLTTARHCKLCNMPYCLKCRNSYETAPGTTIEVKNDNIICTKCLDGLERVLWSDAPMQNYFLDSSYICSPCHLHCKTCQGTGNNCTSCQRGFELFFNQTIQ